MSAPPDRRMSAPPKTGTPHRGMPTLTDSRQEECLPHREGGVSPTKGEIVCRTKCIGSERFILLRGAAITRLMGDSEPLEYESSQAEPVSAAEPPKGALAIIFLIVVMDLLGFGIIIPLLA